MATPAATTRTRSAPRAASAPEVLYILRHAIAEDRRPGLADARRVLTDEGRDKLKRVLLRARSAGVELSLILTSPLLRARQSAEMAADVLKYGGTIVETKALAPQASVEETWTEIRRRASQGAILVCGHEPHLSKLVAHVLASPNLQVDMKKGALVRITFDRTSPQPQGTLEWMLSPKLSRGG
jgi:phosphohistidine phosphatase